MSAGEILLVMVYLFTLFYTIFWLLTLLDHKQIPGQKFQGFPKVSILIPAHNEEKYVKHCVDSVLGLDYPRDNLEIMIVNDGSTDNTLSVCRRIKDDNPDYSITLINTPNRGKWAALNEGLNKATGEFFACLDADSFVSKNALKNLLSHFSEEKIAVVLPLLKVFKPKSFFQRVQWYEYVLNMFYKRLLGLLDSIHVAPGPFSVYRTRVLREIGGFRRAHFTEDFEIVLRIQERHYKIVQASDAIVYTTSPRNLSSILKQRYRWFRGSFLNVWDYRRMLFRVRYGDFGMLQMPVVLLNGFLGVTFFSLMIYLNVLNPAWSGLNDLSLVNFDLFTIFSNLSFSFSILDLNFYKLYILSFFSVFSLFIIFLANRFMKENLLKYGLKCLIFFIFFYYMTVVTVWFKLFWDLLFRREHKW